MRTVRLALAAAVAALGLVPSLVLAAGPPFPEPVENQAVYDTAGVLDAATIGRVEASIDRIEADTGAEIVVYTQLVPDGVTQRRDRGARHRADGPVGCRACGCR